MKTINIDLPFFDGFYESNYESSDTEYHAIHEEMDYLRDECGEEHEYDDFEFDYQRRRDDIIERFVSVFKDYTPECVTDVRYETLVSPRYYNYATDEIYAFVDLADDWKEAFREFISNNKEKLEEQVKTDWTSYDGFMSFVDNRLDDFCEHLFNDEDREQDMYIGIMLAYIMHFNYLNGIHYSENIRWAIVMEVLDGIYDGSYVSLKTAE